MSIMQKSTSLISTLLVVGVLIAVSGILIQSLRDSQASGSKSYDIADAGLNGTVSLGARLPTVGVIAGIALFVLVAAGFIINEVMKLGKNKATTKRRARRRWWE